MVDGDEKRVFWILGCVVDCAMGRMSEGFFLIFS